MDTFIDVVVSALLMKAFKSPNFGTDDKAGSNFSVFCNAHIPNDTKEYHLICNDRQLADQLCSWLN